MRKIAYLTIDDGPTENTKGHVDYLNSKSIPAIMFFLGSNIDRYRNVAIYAVQHGMIIGNHSYSHPQFSKLTLDEAVKEIRRQEALINLIYAAARHARKYKLFRFPYGDKGGANKGKLQEYLKSEGFMKIDPTGITHPSYYEYELDRDWDVFWTFDFGEYAIRDGAGGSNQSILSHTNVMNLWAGGSPADRFSAEIILIHDHAATEIRFPGYFSELLDHTMAMGVEFTMPRFVQGDMRT